MSFKKYAKYYDNIYSDKNYCNETKYLIKIIKKFTNKKKVLEVGCGSGGHAIEFSKLGYQILGLDKSSYMIKIAKRKSKKTKFIVKDAVQFNFNRKFNIVILNFHVINFIKKKVDLKIFFQNCHKSLSKNGLLIFDFINKDALQIFKPKNKLKIINIEKKNIKITRQTKPFLKNNKSILNILFLLKVFKKGKLVDKFREIHKLKIYSFKEYLKFSNAYFDYINDYSCMKLKKIDKKSWSGLLILKKKEI